jgi:hypothetical protein
VISGQKYVTGSNTSFAAMYHQCPLCSNTTVMAYQDINSFVQFANLTTSGWELTQLNVDPVANTGLALQPFLRTSIEDQINLYYQKSSLNLSLATWSPAPANGGGEFEQTILLQFIAKKSIISYCLGTQQPNI